MCRPHMVYILSPMTIMLRPGFLQSFTRHLVAICIIVISLIVVTPNLLDKVHCSILAYRPYHQGFPLVVHNPLEIIRDDQVGWVDLHRFSSFCVDLS